MNMIVFRGREELFEEDRVKVAIVKERFKITGRKAMFHESDGGRLTRHIPDYIDFTKEKKITIEAISDFKLG